MTDLEKQVPKKSEYTLINGLKDLKSVLNVVMLEAVASVVAFTVYMAVKYKVSDTLMIHICCCIIGYGLLMTSSIILFSGENFFGRPLFRYKKALSHMYIIGVGSILSVIGISIEIYSRGDEYPHFTSTHAITGLISMILMLVAVVGGIIMMNMNIIYKYISIKPIWYKIFHNLLGLSAYVVGMCSICYAYDTWWFKFVGSDDQKTIVIVAISIVTAWTSIPPIIQIFQYFKSIFESD